MCTLFQPAAGEGFVVVGGVVVGGVANVSTRVELCGGPGVVSMSLMTMQGDYGGRLPGLG